MDLATILGQATTVLFVIIVFSYLIRDNIAFEFAQATYVGLAVGHGLVMVVNYFRNNTIPAILAGNGILVLPFILGLLLFGRLSRKTLWLYRYPLALLIGSGLALQVRGMLKANLTDQLISTMSISLKLTIEGFNSVVIVLLVVSSMTYFLFTIRGTESKVSPVLNTLMKIGQFALMGAFGAGFASSFLGRLAVFMDVLDSVLFFIPRVLGLM